MSSKSSPKKSARRKAIKLPKSIRDELRMMIALRGYSHMKCGEGRNTKQQEGIMYTFFHGNPPSRPSQVKMLANGEGPYSELYDYSTKLVVDKTTMVSSKLNLKPSLAQDDPVNYSSNIDITFAHLEKRTLTSKLLITGRSLLNMAKKGLKMYKKALAHASKKWDLDKCEPIDSGDTVDDVIEYVRQQMYMELHCSRGNDDSSVDGSDDESDTDNVVTEADPKNGDENLGNDLTTNETEVGDGDNDGGEDEPYDTVGNKPKVKIVNVPSTYIFPSFMAFVIYGPFVEKSKQLTLLLHKEAAKGSTKSRDERRKETAKQMATNRKNDDNNMRGLTIDQKISIANYQLQKRSQLQMENEQRLVALIAHESALSKQIDAAERRAAVRCETYCATNRYWKMVDDLMEQQTEVTASIKGFNGNIESQTSSKIIDLLDLGTSEQTEAVHKKTKLNDSVDIENEDNEDAAATTSTVRKGN